MTIENDIVINGLRQNDEITFTVKRGSGDKFWTALCTQIPFDLERLVLS